MSMPYFSDIVISAIDIQKSGFIMAEYEHCTFEHLDLTSAALKGFVFSECIFTDCNISLCSLATSSFRQVTFKRCKLLGIRWDECNNFLFSVKFEHCILDMCCFYALKLNKTSFISCSLQEADFSEANLSDSSFSDCNLSDAVFDHTNLYGADLTTALHYRIDPEKNIIRHAKFSWPAISGLLSKYDLIIE